MRIFRNFAAGFLFMSLTGCIDSVIETSGDFSDEPDSTEEVNRTEQADSVANPSASPPVERSEVLRKRSEVRGKLFAKLTLAGKSYANANVVDITDREIQLRHRSGVSSVDWGQTKPKVRDAWGYDANAYADALRKEESERRRLESFGNSREPQRSPEEIAHLKKEADKQSKEEREKEIVQLGRRLVTMNSELKRGKSAMTRMTDELEEVEEKYEKQDDQFNRADYIGPDYETSRVKRPVRTSKADRNKELDSMKQKVARARSAIETLEGQIDMVKFELERLESIR